MKIFYELKDSILRDADTKLFDTKDYVCLKFFEDKQGLPVVILRKRTDAPIAYKVIHESSEMFFKTYYDAYMYCKERYHGLLKK